MRLDKINGATQVNQISESAIVFLIRVHLCYYIFFFARREESSAVSYK